MTEGILVRHQVNAQFAAARVEDLDFLCRERAPALPDGFIFLVGERVLGVKLQLVDLEIGKFFGKVEQGLQLRHTAARDVEHHAAPCKVRPVADAQAGQAATVFAEQLPERRRGRAQAAGFAEGNLDAGLGNLERITFGMVRRGTGADDFDGGQRFLLWQREHAAQHFQ